MKLKSTLSSLLSILVFSSFCSAILAQTAPNPMTIWFNKPAADWNEALPVGNGNLGAMIFGGIEKERLELNESTVWTGEKRWDGNPAALKSLAEVRRLLFSGKYKEAEELAQKNIMCWKPENPSATYQALGDLFMDFGHQKKAVNYRRELNIEDAVARVSFTSDNVNYVREIFSSATDHSLVVRLTADRPNSITFTLHLSRQSKNTSVVASGNEISLSEHIGDGKGVKIFTRVRMNADGGGTSAAGDSIRVEKANSVTLLLTAATDYFGGDPSKITLDLAEAAMQKQYTDIRKDHISYYQKLF